MLLELFQRLFESTFMPHGHCFLWKPGLLWLHAGSDAVIALSFFAIPVLLIWFARARKDLAFRWAFVLFGLFTAFCGLTHVMDVWTIWFGTYWVEGSVKAATAVLSAAGAVLLVPLVPKALKLPTPTELQKANEALQKEIRQRKEAEESRRKLEQELLQASERERRRIGQDLHDSLASHLTGLATLTQGLVGKGKREEGTLTVDAESLERISKLAQEGARQARTMARGLNPVKLDEKGLPAALQTLAETQQFRYGTTSSFEEEGTLPDLPKGATLNLYWIAHEAVQNAIKHGEASRITIRLRDEAHDATKAERVILEVIDNGTGLPEPKEELKEGMGLPTMRYRADLVGASLDIQSREDGGVRVSCTLPIPSSPEGTAPDSKTVA